MALLTTIAETASNMFKIPELRRRIYTTFFVLLIYRVGYHVPIPGIDPAKIAAQFAQGGLQDIIGTFAYLSGGSLMQCTLFALGIMPYISAEIIFQLLTKVVPSLEELSKEGDSGRRKIRQYARYATVAICIIQGFFVVAMLRSFGLVDNPSLGFYITAVLTMTAGTFFLMWLGEMINEHGIGNGTSMIIMAGIVADLPKAIGQMITAAQADQKQLLPIFVDIGAFVLVTSVVVLITLAQRRIPIQNAKHARGNRVYGGQRSDLTLKVDQPGVIPIIFSSALLTFPTMIVTGLRGAVDPNDWFGKLVFFLNDEMSRGGFMYVTLYVAMIFFFCFFWTKLMFNPVDLANNLKQYGSFVPGIRPGKQTVEYLDYVVNRITLVGAMFLSLIAIFPMIATDILGLTRQVTRFLGGTGMLIVVGVALDLVHKVEGHLKMRHYDGFLGHGGPRIKGRRG